MTETIKQGDHVLVYGHNDGYVRLIAQMGKDKKTLYAVQLTKPKGTSNGTYEGERLVNCPDYCALFLTPDKLKPFDARLQATVTIQCCMRQKLARRAAKRKRNSKVWNALDNMNENLLIQHARTIEEVQKRSPKGKKLFKEVAMLTMITSSKQPKEGFEELDQVEMESTYCGPKLTFPITLEQVLDMFEAFKRGETLHYNYVTRILYETGKMYKNAKNLQEISIPENCKFTIVGDLHGQLEDLFTIFSLNGLPSPTNMYLFNGDWVDRGVNGCECVMAVFAFKMLYPGSVFHNRGNHESRAQNAYMGFEDEILEKYDGSPYRDPTRARRLLRMFELVFDEIPLSAVVQGKVFVTHGGLPGSRLNLQHINGINRRREPPIDKPSLEDKLYESLLWSDPRPTANFPEPLMGYRHSDRGAGVEFGTDVTEAFCSENRIALVVRSHECVQEGYEVLHGGRLITIFSASCYCNMMTNKGSFINFGTDLQPEIQQFYAQSLVDSSFAQKIMDKKLQKLEEDTVKMIVERIIDKKADLYWYFTQVDVKRTGKISRLEWANALKSVLNLDLPFISYAPKLVDMDDNKMIDYSNFLNRFRIQITAQDGDWSKNLLEGVCKKLFLVCSDLREAFNAFDTNHDGTIEYNEFFSLLKSLDIGLSNDQIYELMRSIDVNGDHSINYKEFVDRFQVTFEQMKGGNGNSNQITDPWLHSIIKKIGEKIIIQYNNVEKAFQEIDSDNSGLIDDNEFMTAIKKLDLGLSDEEILKVSAALDSDHSGKIDYKEFADAFKVKESKNAGQNIIQQITNVLYQHRMQLRSAFRMFDANNDGKISKDEFLNALNNMNLALDSPITPEQVDELMSCLDKDGNGSLDYKEFFEGFKIVDTKSHNQ